MENATIAVVEDDPAFLSMVHELLSDEGYLTVLCADSEDAYPLIRRRRPDLVLLDLRMEDPEAGWRILLLLRQDQGTAHIPVIMFSAARHFLQLRARVLRHKCCATLEKPFSADDLLWMVRSGLDPQCPAWWV
jgi:CheY-like chemotaxis protein